MQTHSSRCLTGPVSVSRMWWQTMTPNQPTDHDRSEKPLAIPQDEEADFRADLVARVRREIAEGTYDTPEKWEIALDNLCKRLNQND